MSYQLQFTHCVLWHVSHPSRTLLAPPLCDNALDSKYFFTATLCSTERSQVHMLGSSMLGKVRRVALGTSPNPSLLPVSLSFHEVRERWCAVIPEGDAALIGLQSRPCQQNGIGYVSLWCPMRARTDSAGWGLAGRLPVACWHRVSCRYVTGCCFCLWQGRAAVHGVSGGGQRTRLHLKGRPRPRSIENGYTRDPEVCSKEGSTPHHLRDSNMRQGCP